MAAFTSQTRCTSYRDVVVWRMRRRTDFRWCLVHCLPLTAFLEHYAKDEEE